MSLCRRALSSWLPAPRIEQIGLSDKVRRLIPRVLRALEVQNLFEVAEATAIAAEERKESRGAHARGL